jgi:hypothetical protein
MYEQCLFYTLSHRKLPSIGASVEVYLRKGRDNHRNNTTHTCSPNINYYSLDHLKEKARWHDAELDYEGSARGTTWLILLTVQLAFGNDD